MSDKSPAQDRIILQQENLAPGKLLGFNTHVPGNASHAGAGINIIRKELSGNAKRALVGCIQTNRCAVFEVVACNQTGRFIK